MSTYVGEVLATETGTVVIQHFLAGQATCGDPRAVTPGDPSGSSDTSWPQN